MKKIKIAGVLFGILALTILGCKTNPFTGQKNLNFVSNDNLFPTAFQQYGDFLKENKVVTGTAEAKKIEDIGIKIKKAAELYLNSIGQKDYLKGYAWEYKLVESEQLNAWCMPGGKIVFYTGILSTCKNDAGIATVMGHEVAHALANHGAQRMSAQQLQMLGSVGVAIATSKESRGKQMLWQAAYGIGSQLGAILPFGRSHESEADMIGLTLMTIAGYNPEEAVYFWQRMSEKKTGKTSPEILSTHPSDANRIANLKKLIPQAKEQAAKLGVISN